MAPKSSLERLLEAGPYRTAVVVVLAGLVVAAVAVPRFAGIATEIVATPKLAVQTETRPPVTSAQAEPPSPTTGVTSVPDQPVPEPPSIVPSTVAPRSSDNKVAEARVVPKWNGDWQAATAHLDHGSGKPVPATTGKVTPATTASSVGARSSAANADSSNTASVTIGGCLEISVDGERFRLTDTEGMNAPKARNWRSGFLKKQSAAVELLEIADPATARNYVGQRVTVTGLVEDREMRVRSLKTAGNRCE